MLKLKKKNLNKKHESKISQFSYCVWNQLLFFFYVKTQINMYSTFRSLQQSCREQKKRSTRKFVNSHASHFDEFFSRFKIVAEAFNMAHRNNFWYMIAYHFTYFWMEKFSALRAILTKHIASCQYKVSFYF